MGVKILSDQEKKIAHLTANGLIAKEIGLRLFISTFTVQTHLRNIRKKLNAKNIADITRVYILSLPNASDVLKVMFFMILQFNLIVDSNKIDLRKPLTSQIKTHKTLRNRHEN